MTDLAFTTFGNPARWAGIDDPVLVRSKKRGEDDGFGPVRVATTSIILRVRASDVPLPQAGAQVTILTGRLAGSYVVRRGALLDDKGVWDCPVDVAA